MTPTVSAPASSGNLGPGFDTLALALDLRCEVRANPAGATTIEEGEGVETLEEGDLISRAVGAAAGRPMHLEIRNAIPRARGLGSSAAVAAAAAGASMIAAGAELDRERVYEIVGALEGHDDNAAAAVYGGLVAVSGGEVANLPIADQWRFVVAIPHARLPTKQARAALDPEIDRSAVVRTLGRLAFLTEGLRTGDAGMLSLASGDEIHEVPRAQLSPITGALMESALDAGAAHAAWSGAGPSVLAFVTDHTEAAVMAALRDVLGGGGDVREVAVDRLGLVVRDSGAPLG